MAQCIYQHMPNFYQLTESVKTLVLKVLRDRWLMRDARARKFDAVLVAWFDCSLEAPNTS